jgi:Cytochrome c7 and related cytochrome c
MPQIFHPSTNTISKLSIFGAMFFVMAALAIILIVNRSPYVTQVDVVRDQPVPFSHEHHVRGLGLDCRYCHTSVETSSFAGIPPTETCMTCHSQIWAESPMLEPVRQSYRTNQPLAWNRVHDLPDFAYFNHSIHVAKGIGCASCHGQVDRMPLMWKDQPLTMEWCLACHRAPESQVRPREFIFDMEWQAPGDQFALGKKLVREYEIEADTGRLSNCSTCHR